MHENVVSVDYFIDVEYDSAVGEISYYAGDTSDVGTYASGCNQYGFRRFGRPGNDRERFLFIPLPGV